ncbi:transcriptional regulator, ROK family protein [Streptomyces formicae]|uniref:Transcriptional regulator, ROK family protein n=1 Tax=Streptomyces formicae TaxID=1616117 RepID=A0A291QLY6_9ACTN|nr:transcriptional regulator, ROK family protein [Streptomyces formicae]
MVREAGRSVGEVLAGLVNFFNPDTVVVGGALAAVLRIEPSRTGENAAAVGAGILAVEHALSPRQVDRVLAGAAR